MANEKDSYEVSAPIRKLVLEQARLDAAAYVLEFAEVLDPSQTDWDATAWGEHAHELPPAPTDSPDLLWPIYQAHLIDETKRLMAMIDDPTALVWNLSSMVTRNEEGRHFTELYREETLRDLEALQFIAIERPIHDRTGLAFDASCWTVEVTPRGLELIAGFPEHQPPADGDSHAGEEFALTSDPLPVLHGGKAPGFWMVGVDTFYLTPAGRVWLVMDPDGFTDDAPVERDLADIGVAESVDHLLNPDEIIPILKRLEEVSGETLLQTAEAPLFELKSYDDVEEEWNHLGHYARRDMAFAGAILHGPGLYRVLNPTLAQAAPLQTELRVDGDGQITYRETGTRWHHWPAS